MTPTPTEQTEQDDEFLRALVFPEEDRARWTTAPSRGEFRWFRSPNVIPLERFRPVRNCRRIRGEVFTAKLPQTR
jgi:hypothetical protein